MSHYESQMMREHCNFTEKTAVFSDELTEKLLLISKKREVISDAFESVKSSEKLIAFSEKVKKTSGVGIVGLLPKLSDVVPELTPVFSTFSDMNEVTNLQFEVIELLAERLKNLEKKV